MNFALFDSLTSTEARDYLQRFLEAEATAVESLRALPDQVGLDMNFSVVTLPSVLRWIMGHVRIVRIPVPNAEPEWIRRAHKEGFVDFDEESRLWVLRGAYYLGESFVRSYPSLRWTTGDPEYVEKNMPVVAGFLSGDEMAPMMVVANLFARILGDGAPVTEIDRAIAAWTGDVAQQGHR